MHRLARQARRMAPPLSLGLLLANALPQTCVLCPNSYGAFKQTTTAQWAHLLCAIWIPDTGVSNTVYMEPIDGVENISKNRWKLVRLLSPLPRRRMLNSLVVDLLPLPKARWRVHPMRQQELLPGVPRHLRTGGWARTPYEARHRAWRATSLLREALGGMPLPPPSLLPPSSALTSRRTSPQRTRTSPRRPRIPPLAPP